MRDTMKHIKIILTVLLAAVIIISCFKSNLNQPVLALYGQADINNKKGVEELLIGTYSMLDGESSNNPNPNVQVGSAGSNWIYGSICGGEAYKGSKSTDLNEITYLQTFTEDATNDFLEGKWTAVYEGVQRANAVLRTMRLAKDMTVADTVETRAEAVFLRAFYYFEAKKMWNRIPYIDESVTYDADNYHVVNDTSWAPIENDLIYAATNLPDTQLNAIGRVNKYAAEAILAKAYMFEHKYALAEPLLTDLITNGETSGGAKYTLLGLYQHNFNAQYKNSTESVFGYQSSVNETGGGQNGNIGDEYNFPNGGESGCCGFFQPSQYLVNHFKTDSATGLPDLDHFNDPGTDVTNDQGLLSSDPFTPYGGTLDPRLDWTVGRRGIPYLDWGVNPGNVPAGWIRDQASFGPYNPIKNVFLKSQEGTYTETSWSVWTALNINLVRYADVLLWAAEAEIMMPGGDLEKARGYVNQIRTRAMNPDGWVHTYIDPNNPTGGYTDTPAANYKIGLYTTPWTDPAFALKAVQYERMLELGMEGHRFFDLVRWGIAETELNAFFMKEKNFLSFLNTGHFSSPKNLYFPIPQNEIDISANAGGIGKLIQNPGY
jgi:starch-binding outer membrane protein, SusD/RagB family